MARSTPGRERPRKRGALWPTPTSLGQQPIHRNWQNSRASAVRSTLKASWRRGRDSSARYGNSITGSPGGDDTMRQKCPKNNPRIASSPLQARKANCLSQLPCHRMRHLCPICHADVSGGAPELAGNSEKGPEIRERRPEDRKNGRKLPLRRPGRAPDSRRFLQLSAENRRAARLGGQRIFGAFSGRRRRSGPES